VHKLRMTYLDAGTSAQIFNTLLYPHPSLELPLFGADLLLLGKSKVLVGLDFVPLTRHHEYLRRYCESPLAAIRASYEWMASEHSGKLYPKEEPAQHDGGSTVDDDAVPESFFSPGMFFARPGLSTGSMCHVFSAFTKYALAYSELLARAKEDRDTGRGRRGFDWNEQEVLRRHRAFDVWQHKYDPAPAMLKGYFGQEWTDRYTEAILFGL